MMPAKATASRKQATTNGAALKLRRGAAQPQYVQLAEYLRCRITRGELQSGDPLPTLRAMRGQGVTQFTLDKAHDILEQEGLIVREQRRGTFVAHSHQRPRKGVIAFCGGDVLLTASSPYWARLIEGVHETLDAENMQLLLWADPNADGLQNKADGALVNGGGADFIPDWWQAQRWPGVALLYPLDGISSVTADQSQGVRLALEYLLKLGHKRIAYLHGDDMWSSIKARLAVYHATLRAAGIAPQPSWLCKLNDQPMIYFHETGLTTMRDWLERKADNWCATGCTALLAQNDETALGAMAAFQEAGWRVPEDVSVVGFDGTELCEMARPRLTSVEVPLREIGRRSAQILLRQLKDNAGDTQHIELPVQLRIRQSAGPPKM